MQGSQQTTELLNDVTCLILCLRYCYDLNNLINCFHSVVDSLNEAKFIMLAQHINAVHEELQFGCKRLNWNSLGML